MLLSSRGLSYIASEEQDFIFRVNEHKFATSTFRAQFISPAVSELLRSDSTVRTFEITRPGAHNCFHHFISFANGESVTIPSPHTDLFVALCRDLGNHEILELMAPNEPPSVENIAVRLLIHSRDSDVGYACENFALLNHRSFSVETLRMLLSDDRVVIENEDWLLDIVLDLIEIDESYGSLLDTIECRYLSDAGIRWFCELVNPESLHPTTWGSICRRLCLGVHPEDRNPRLQKVRERTIELDWGKPFDGVFQSLFRKCSGNPHHCGLISVSVLDGQASSHTFPCEDLISSAPKTGKHWGTNGTKESPYIQIDFKELRISPSAYSVKAHSRLWSSSTFVRSWVFEGSVDGLSWESLDRHSGSIDLCSNDAIGSYQISKPGVFSFLRFRMVEKNTSHSWQLGLQQIEVFGRLIGEKD
jgi:hypothetical protein